MLKCSCYPLYTVAPLKPLHRFLSFLTCLYFYKQNVLCSSDVFLPILYLEKANAMSCTVWKGFFHFCDCTVQKAVTRSFLCQWNVFVAECDTCTFLKNWLPRFINDMKRIVLDILYIRDSMIHTEEDLDSVALTCSCRRCIWSLVFFNSLQLQVFDVKLDFFCMTIFV